MYTWCVCAIKTHGTPHMSVTYLPLFISYLNNSLHYQIVPLRILHVHLFPALLPVSGYMQSTMKPDM